MRAELKLFVWKKFLPYFSDGLAVAIAYTEDGAKEIIKSHFDPDHWTDVYEECRTAEEIWGEVEVFPLERGIGFCVVGGQ